MTGMEDLVTWLRAQLDEDERAARAAAESLRCGCHPGSYAGAWTARDTTVDAEMHNVAGGEEWPAAVETEVAEHIARWDPARVLAEVDAKRRILELHAPVNDYDPNGPVCSTCGEAGNPGDETAVVRWPCTTVRLLALPLAGRSGYREEWRP